MKERELVLKRLACAKTAVGFDALCGEHMLFRDTPAGEDARLVDEFCAVMLQQFARGGPPCR